MNRNQRRRIASEKAKSVVTRYQTSRIFECPHMETFRLDSEPHIVTQRIFERTEITDGIRFEITHYLRFCDDCRADMETITGRILADGYECTSENPYGIMTPEQSGHWAKQNGYGPGHSLKGNPQA